MSGKPAPAGRVGGCMLRRLLSSLSHLAPPFLGAAVFLGASLLANSTAGAWAVAVVLSLQALLLLDLSRRLRIAWRWAAQLSLELAEERATVRRLRWALEHSVPKKPTTPAPDVPTLRRVDGQA